MLVLTRKKGEQIRIGNQVIVTVLEVHQGQIRLGFEAPTEVRIFREEVWREFGNSLTTTAVLPPKG